MKRLAFAATVLGALSPGLAGADSGAPFTARADLEEKLGAKVASDLVFRDAAGRSVELGEILREGRPIVLVLSYEKCTMLCSLVLRGLSQAVRQGSLRPGADYTVLGVSIDPDESPALTKQRQARLLGRVGLPEASTAVRFVVGSGETTARLAESIGFRYAYDEQTKQWAHPAVVTVLTAEGVVSRYLYGIEYRARDLDFALIEAGKGLVGTLTDRVLLACYRYDPSQRRYGLHVQWFLKIGAGLVLGAVLWFLIALARRERRA